MRLYAIGDIHGRDDLLGGLLECIEEDRANFVGATRLIFLGDYIDRGLQSKDVLGRLYALSLRDETAVFLKGNHEDAMLRFLEGLDEDALWLSFGGVETLQSYGVETSTMARASMAALVDRALGLIPEEHIAFLRKLELSATFGDYMFVHAGVRPDQPLDAQTPADLMWIRNDFLNSDIRPDKTIVHGHTPNRTPVDLGWRIGVDTGAGWNGQLTAVVLEGESRRFLQAG
ncbi:MAG: metallophosphoesterase [Pseudomonadota bacterium]